MSNGLFAAQMTTTMTDHPIQSASEHETELEPPCHGDMLETDNTEMSECCEGDCSDCMLSLSLIQPAPATLNSIHQAITLAINNHLLPAHSSNLDRPPSQI